VELMEHQLNAIEQLGSGKILWGGVGTGKTAAVLGYYDKAEKPRDIYVITTAKKRDSLDWEREAANFGVGTESLGDSVGILHIDSWNQIGKYEEVEDAFFVFDEQRLVGTGAWVKSFIKIARKNHWVLLSATPGDTWLDYAPVFIANGFYKNITRFKFEHVLYEPYTKYPKIKGYLNERKLELLRNDILVEMPYLKHTTRYLNYVPVSFDEEKYRRVTRDRWNIYEDRPIKDVAEMFRLMRKVVNSDPSRVDELRFLMTLHPRLVVFYSFDYELEILRKLGLEVPIFEWNGHKKDPPPQTKRWVYLVQYVAGAEAWNCTSTDAMVLYSLTYSYKNFEQAQGRIDRLDTPFSALYYYIFSSDSKIDREIKKALSEKHNFNERKFVEKWVEK
jgi:hypothetical protein